MHFASEKDKKAVREAIRKSNQGLFGLISRDKYFETDVIYPQKTTFPLVKICTECGAKHKNEKADADFKSAMRKYREDHNRLVNLFKYACLYDCGILEHPKADKAFDMAWAESHSSGYYEVYQTLCDLAELLRD